MVFTEITGVLEADLEGRPYQCLLGCDVLDQSLLFLDWPSRRFTLAF